MAKIVLVGQAGQEQAWGGTPFSGKNQAVIMLDSNTNNVYSLDGHMFNDAPEYETVEVKYGKRIKVVGGRNQSQDYVIAPEYNKRVTITAMTPQRTRSVLMNFYDLQERGNKLHLAIVPNECLEGCDQWFIVAKQARMSVPKFTSGLVSDDENEAALDTETAFTGEGDFVRFEGLTTTPVTTQGASNAVYALAYDFGGGCGDAGTTSCLNQNIVRVGDGFAEQSTDGGGNWSAITITAITTDVVGAIITGAVRAGNNWVFSYADVADGTATDGGLAYSINGAAAVVAHNTTGSQGVVKAFSKYYGFGTAGSIAVSADNGVSWTNLTSGITEDILAADFDETNQLLFLACTGGKAYAYDGTTFNDISTYVGASTTDLTSVAVVTDNKTIFGDASGNIYENQVSYILDTNYTKIPVGTGAINFIAGDQVGGFRTVVSEGANIWTRDIFTEQEFELLGTMSDTILCGNVGDQLTGYAGGNYILGANDGTTTMVQNCNLCIL